MVVGASNPPHSGIAANVTRAPQCVNTSNAPFGLRKKENWMSGLSLIDGIGFSAAGLVLATFCMRSITALRWVAIASNVAFIAYGYLEGLAPVLLLHMLLLPVNICRLAQLYGAEVRSNSSQGQEAPVRSQMLSFFDALKGEVLKRRRVLPSDRRLSWMQSRQ